MQKQGSKWATKLDTPPLPQQGCWCGSTSRRQRKEAPHRHYRRIPRIYRDSSIGKAGDERGGSRRIVIWAFHQTSRRHASHRRHLSANSRHLHLVKRLCFARRNTSIDYVGKRKSEGKRGRRLCSIGRRSQPRRGVLRLEMSSECCFFLFGLEGAEHEEGTICRERMWDKRDESGQRWSFFLLFFRFISWVAAEASEHVWHI